MLEWIQFFVLLFFKSFLLIYVLMLCVRFYMRTTNKMCESKASMKGKVIIVTGGNAGIGFHTAKDLASRGGRVILACRNDERGITARDKIIAETGNQEVIYMQLNLSSLTSVRRFTHEFKEIEKRLHVLINNAGIYGLFDRCTEDNIVEGMQVNFFAPFLLTLLLMPQLIKSKGRVVNLSSILHYFGSVNLVKINEVNYYSNLSGYCSSKLFLLMFTKELSRRVRDAGVTVNAVHPGAINTNILDNTSWWFRNCFAVLCWIFGGTVEEGAQTVIDLVVSDEWQDVSGELFNNYKPRSVMYKAKNVVLARNLWAYAEKLVGYKNDEST